MRTKKPAQSENQAPVIFAFHDYRLFLRAWFDYLKASQPGFSLRAIAKKANLATGYLPMVLSGNRPLTGKALGKLQPFLQLNASEQSFLEKLVTLGTTDSHETRLSALNQMSRFQTYLKHNQKDAEVYEYLTHWYYVAIREMAALPDFKLDAGWIQSRLRIPVPQLDIKNALGFLVENGYLEVAKDGSVHPPEKALDCTGGVFRVALSAYHKELLDLAALSIENTPSTERQIAGHTFSISTQNFDQAREIINEALQKIQKLGADETKADSIYHFEVALFPLTKGSSEK